MHAKTARNFLKIHLPVKLRKLCNLNTLHLKSKSFIKKSLKKHSTNVLYSMQMQGNPGYLHVVIKHQSKPNKKITFRIMRYSIAAMHRHLKANHNKLPLVVPILFYQGKATPYPLSMCWFNMFYSPKLAQRVYNSPFPLVNITITPNNKIMQHRQIAILKLLQKHIRQRNLMLLLKQLVTLINKGYTSKSQLVAMQNYMLQRGHTKQANLFYGVLKNKKTKKKSIITLAQWFKKKKIKKKIQQKKQKVSQKFAQRLLSKGMSQKNVAKMANLPLAKINKVINLI